MEWQQTTNELVVSDWSVPTNSTPETIALRILAESIMLNSVEENKVELLKVCGKNAKRNNAFYQCNKQNSSLSTLNTYKLLSLIQCFRMETMMKLEIVFFVRFKF